MDAPTRVSHAWAAAALRYLVSLGWTEADARAACKARNSDLLEWYRNGIPAEEAVDWLFAAQLKATG